MALHFHHLTVTDVRRETDDCVSVCFEVPGDLRDQFLFTPGQNLTLRHFAEGREIRRSYSICSSPLENELRVAIKKVPGGAFSTFAGDHLRPGDVLEVLSPSGSFFTPIRVDQKKNYCFFAAGSGITPVISLMKTILAVEPESFVILVYGNRNASSIIFRDELSNLKDTHLERLCLHYILSRELTDADIHHGRIDADKCSRLWRLYDFGSVDEFFICGPEPMIFEVKGFLENRGIGREKIHFELFTTPAGQPRSRPPREAGTNAQGCSVTIRADGRSFSFRLDRDSNVILDAALATGADLPFACKGGVCCTCKAKLVEGKVEMDTNYGLEPDEVKAGFILTCQSHPASDTVVIDFDAK